MKTQGAGKNMLLATSYPNLTVANEEKRNKASQVNEQYQYSIRQSQ